MKFDKYFLPVFAEGDGAGSSPPAPPADPPSNPTDPNPEALASEDSWLLGQFDAMRADDASEDIDMVVEPTAPAPVSGETPEKPEGVLPPSQQAVAGQETPRAVATPLPVVSAPTTLPPAVGVSGNQLAGQPASPAPPPLDPTRIMAQIAEGIQNQRQAFIEKLATEQYALSEKQMDDLGLTPEAAKLWALQMASVHVNATQSITRMQAEQLPAYVEGLHRARSENQRKEDEFFGEFPELRSAPKDQLGQVLQMVSQIHPTLKGVEWRKKAGETALATLGIQRQAPQANGRAQAPPPQQIRTPGPIVRQTNGLAYAPSGTSTTPAPAEAPMSDAEKFFRLLQMTDAGDFET